jgi:hypothetical protein
LSSHQNPGAMLLSCPGTWMKLVHMPWTAMNFSTPNHCLVLHSFFVLYHIAAKPLQWMKRKDSEWFLFQVKPSSNVECKNKVLMKLKWQEGSAFWLVSYFWWNNICSQQSTSYRARQLICSMYIPNRMPETSHLEARPAFPQLKQRSFYLISCKCRRTKQTENL